jgi:Mrp family chromosome partitioning ATPase
MIPAGTQTDLNKEAFTTARMRRLIEDVYRRYPERYVILDAPPLTESADTQILAELCDYVLVVIPYGRVTASTAAEAMKNLDPKKIVGVVLNGEPSLPQARVFPTQLPVVEWIDAVRSWVVRLVGRSPKAARSDTKAR